MSADYGRRSTDLTVAPVVPVWEVAIPGQPERVLPPEWSWLRARAAYLWLRLTAYLKSWPAQAASAYPNASNDPAVVREPARQQPCSTSNTHPVVGAACGGQDHQLTYEGSR